MAPKPKLTPVQEAEIRAIKAADQDISNDELAERFGVGRTTIAIALAKADAPATSITPLAHDVLVPDPENERKTFDEESIAELAESIAQRGLLQNLIAKPADADGIHFITAGERRWRAIGLLIAQNRWTGPLPVLVKPGTSAQHRIDNIIENLLREAVPPMEEAEALAKLQDEDPTIFTPRAIAEQLGKSPRYVQQRLALARKLSPEAKQRLASKSISVECARLLSALDAPAQLEIMTTLDEECQDEEGGWGIEELRWHVDNIFVPTCRAIFDLAAADLATFEDNGDEFFLDRQEFWTHQNVAIDAKAEELRQAWKFVDIIKPGDTNHKNWNWDYDTEEELPPSECGVVLFILNNGKVQEHHHQVRITDEDQPPSNGSGSTPVAPTPEGDDASASNEEPTRQIEQRIEKDNPDKATSAPFTKTHIYHAHRRKTAALRAVVYNDPLLAKRLACFALLKPSNAFVKIQGCTHNLMMDDRVPLTDNHQAAIDSRTTKVKKQIATPHGDHKAELAIWRHLISLSNPEIDKLLAAVIAREVSTPAGYDCSLGDYPAIVEIAKAAGLAGAEEEYGLTVTRDDANGVRKQTLLHLADEFGTPGVNDELSPKAIADAIAEHGEGHVMPTLRFGSTAELEALIKKVGK